MSLAAAVAVRGLPVGCGHRSAWDEAYWRHHVINPNVFKDLISHSRPVIIDPSPWADLDEAVLYYYLLDFEENQPSSSFRRPGEPDAIWWFGFPREGLPARPSDIPEAHRYTPSPGASSAKHGRNQDKPVITEPRRYGNPL